MARLLLGVSGGIAAYKALETARLAVKAGHAVRVIQTPTSERFVGRASFEAITGAPVLTSEFERADLYLIAPASANTLAKLAHGQADNLLSTAALAASCPVLVAPAMNDRMYRHPATRANLEQLAARGVVVIGPGEGELASHGEHGIGRLAEPKQLLEACEAVLASRGPRDTGWAGPRDARWAGLRVLVTAGGTREPIDSVRYIGNRSSGRMGVALAARAAARGAEVTLVGANLSVTPPPGITVIEVRTAAEMQAACESEFPRADVLLMAAAVADLRPAAPVAHKLKKSDPSAMPSSIEVEPTEDIIAKLAAGRRRGQLLVGFAAEHGQGAIAYGRRKLESKRLDAVVVNDISRPDIGFESDANEVVIVTAGGERGVPRASKEEVADAVLDELERQREEADGGARADARSTARI
jgi:phosphopantothenoylcysteine decarboxylase/phosphopantothenate--cysteine ligase